MTEVVRLFVLLCGYEILRKSISTQREGERFVISAPICAYLLDTRRGWVLLDAGYDPDHIGRITDLQAFFDRVGCYPPVVGAEHRLEAQLEAIGVRPADIGQVVLSHMHNDHTGFLKHLKGAEVFVQRREWNFAEGPNVPGSYARSDYQDLDVTWRLMDGDWALMPGVSLIDTRGHTHGHQSALIDLPASGRLVLAFDAGDLQENFDREILPGALVDEAAARTSLLRLKALANEPGSTLVLFHDSDAVQRMRLAPDYYE
ncbi:MAG TPA: N-acyl homoserine lactonase family protein [Caulobacteraceae bacterium]|nr:N-acyl homoserine lactonase family protein [Caulobacteraceae bacterium]